MSHPHPHHLKRLQHDVNTNLHLSSHNHQSNNYRPQLPNGDAAIRESLQQFTISTNPQFSRPFNPGPQRAFRGGGGGRPRGHHWHSSLILPKRAINYDLAESFMDHSTNPLSSDAYKLKLKHSTKQWPDGRFKNYREKQDKLDGNIVEIVCTRTIPVVAKRKRIPEVDQNESNDQANSSTPLLALPDPVVQEEKKKQVDQQSNIYANFYGVGRIPRLSSTTQTRKPASTGNSTSASISLLGEYTTDPQS